MKIKFMGKYNNDPKSLPKKRDFTEKCWIFFQRRKNNNYFFKYSIIFFINYKPFIK